MNCIEVVNIAALGNLHREIEIETLAHDLELAVTNYDPKFNASFFRFEEDGELIILYSSGKYILRGGKSIENVRDVNQQFLNTLREVGIKISSTSLEIKNVVAVGTIDTEVDLNELSIELGLENIEYEPEQFPGLVYRPSDTNCVLLVFGSGKVVITGGRSVEEDTDAFEKLRNRIIS